MADKAISALPTATILTAADLFVLSQSNQAKNTTWQTIIGYLTTALDGHGGIQSIAKTGTSGLTDTYTITFADATTATFTVVNGKGVSSIAYKWAVSSSDSTVPSTWYNTRQTMTATNRYLWSYAIITYNDGTTAETTKTVVGVYGDTGQQAYVWIKYSGVQPTSDSDMSDTPDNWIGVYSGTASTAPTHYTDYNWFEIKGETGDPATLDNTNSSVTYQVGDPDGTMPSGVWTDTFPTDIPESSYLWTKTTIKFNTGSAITSYTYSRQGRDGSGSPATSVPLADNTNGAVGTSELFARADHRHPLPTASNILMTSGHSVQADVAELLTFEALHIVGTVSASALYISDNRITADMRVLECIWGTPSNVQSDIGWTTSGGRITFSGTFGGSTTVDLVLGKTN